MMAELWCVVVMVPPDIILLSVVVVERRPATFFPWRVEVHDTMLDTKFRLSRRLRRRLADEIEGERLKALGRPQPGRRKSGWKFPTVRNTLHRRGRGHWIDKGNKARCAQVVRR